MTEQSSDKDTGLLQRCPMMGRTSHRPPSPPDQCKLPAADIMLFSSFSFQIKWLYQATESASSNRRLVGGLPGSTKMEGAAVCMFTIGGPFISIWATSSEQLAGTSEYTDSLTSSTPWSQRWDCLPLPQTSGWRTSDEHGSSKAHRPGEDKTCLDRGVEARLPGHSSTNESLVGVYTSLLFIDC